MDAQGLAARLPSDADWVNGSHRLRHRRTGLARSQKIAAHGPPQLRPRRLRSPRPFQRRTKRALRRLRRQCSLPRATSARRPQHRQPHSAARLAAVPPQRLQVHCAATLGAMRPSLGRARSEGRADGRAHLYHLCWSLLMAHSQRLHAWRSQAFQPVAGDLCHDIGLCFVLLPFPRYVWSPARGVASRRGQHSISPSNRLSHRCTGSPCRHSDWVHRWTSCFSNFLHVLFFQFNGHGRDKMSSVTGPLLLLLLSRRCRLDLKKASTLPSSSVSAQATTSEWVGDWSNRGATREDVSSMQTCRSTL